ALAPGPSEAARAGPAVRRVAQEDGRARRRSEGRWRDGRELHAWLGAHALPDGRSGTGARAISRLAVFCIRPEPAYRAQAISHGLARLGYKLYSSPYPNNRFSPHGPEDLLVIWNRKRGIDEQGADAALAVPDHRSEEHTSELQSRDKPV